MEFVARKSDLLRELSLLQGLAQPTRTLPILSHVRLEAEGDAIQFAATDLEVGMRTGCPATVTSPGVLAIPGRAFFDIVRSFPNADTDVRVVADANGAKVYADKFDGHMITMPAGDYPTIPDGETATALTLQRAPWRGIASKVMFCMSTDNARYYLNGALLVLTPTLLTLVTTDGHRLAIATRPLTPAVEGAPAEVRTLLSRKTLGELLRLLSDVSEVDFTYAATAEHLVFHVRATRPDPTEDDGARVVTQNRVLMARLIDAQFPSYDRVIPTDLTHIVEFNRDALVTAVRRVAILADGRTRAVKLAFKKGKVDVMAMSPERGEGSEPLPVDYTAKKGLTIGFNAQYLLEGLMACGTAAVSMAMKDEGSQILLKPVNPQGFDYTYVLMPMRLG